MCDGEVGAGRVDGFLVVAVVVLMLMGDWSLTMLVARRELGFLR